MDVVAQQVQALQAKFAALLLHPRRPPPSAWKVLMRAAFTRQVPGLGYAACYSAGWSRAAVQEVQEGWIGMWGTGGRFTISGHTGCCRRQSGQPVWHMLHEPAASNCQLATVDRPNGLLASGSRLLKHFVEACQLPVGQPVTIGHVSILGSMNHIHASQK